jgi:hypothetical protein
MGDMRPIDLYALLALIGVGCLVVITIAVGHLAAWW